MAKKLVFDNVVVIEDSHSLLGSKIKIDESNMYTDLMSIAEIEEIEDRLIQNETPYVLAQVETVLSDPLRYARGYVLFTRRLQ